MQAPPQAGLCYRVVSHRLPRVASRAESRECHVLYGPGSQLSIVWSGERRELPGARARRRWAACSARCGQASAPRAARSSCWPTTSGSSATWARRGPQTRRPAAWALGRGCGCAAPASCSLAESAGRGSGRAGRLGALCSVQCAVCVCRGSCTLWPVEIPERALSGRSPGVRSTVTKP